MPTTYEELLRAYEERGRKIALVTNYLHGARRNRNADPACIIHDLTKIIEEK